MVTTVAAWQKIVSADPKLGFFAAASGSGDQARRRRAAAEQGGSRAAAHFQPAAGWLADGVLHHHSLVRDPRHGAHLCAASARQAGAPGPPRHLISRRSWRVCRCRATCRPPRRRGTDERLAATAVSLPRCVGSLRAEHARRFGDDAYERYLAHHAAEHPDEPPMSRKDYFVQRQQQKWTGVTRCC